MDERNGWVGPKVASMVYKRMEGATRRERMRNEGVVALQGNGEGMWRTKGAAREGVRDGKTE